MASLQDTVISDTGALVLARGNTASRPGTPLQGMIRFNTGTQVTEYYDGSQWRAIDDKVRATYTVATLSQYGPYNVLTYLSNGTFTPTYPGYVDVLVVGGGGAGGYALGGGGGAGGVIVAYSVPVTSQTYTITVGNGGTGGSSEGLGGDSTAFGIVANGGGSGDGYPSGNGRSGGSGGGAGSNQSNLNIGGSSTGNNLNGYNGIIYGSRGGDQRYARSSTPTRAAGGGGAGGPGHDTDSRTSSSTLDSGYSDGGCGILIDFDGLGYYYGGGGGGGGYTGNTRGGCGGVGGGGAAGCNSASENAKGGRLGRNVPADAQGVGFGSSDDPAGTPGGANTGGGGGGGGWNAGSGGAGGSGIVIIRYLK